MTDTYARRLRRMIAGAGLILALGAGTTALAGTASAATAVPTDTGWAAATAAPNDTGWAAAAPAATRSPGPVRNFHLTNTPGGGARTLGFTASWRPAQANGGKDLRYAVELRDDLGGVVSSQTTVSTSVTLYGDYCLAPYTVTVRAQTTDPGTGATLTGPPVSGKFGKRNLCTINMSITAVPGQHRGEIDVTLHQNPPLDPFVSGPCALFVDGVQVWSGTCGGAQADRVVTIRSQPGQAVDIVLRTTTPRNKVLESNHVRTDAS